MQEIKFTVTGHTFRIKMDEEFYEFIKKDLDELESIKENAVREIVARFLEKAHQTFVITKSLKEFDDKVDELLKEIK